MITCIIEYDLNPYQRSDFEQYAKVWGQAIPQCGAELIGYFAPHEGSTTKAFGIYNVDDLAAYEAYRARLSAHPLGKENYEFAMDKKFIRSENRAFYKLVSQPHAWLIPAKGAPK
ncbi:MAG: NIPSNAP family protein [Hyphomicrobiales bacterium]|nr:MAG: NIPSNAP family protein [Hyphomicrobiales bacterium]